MYGETSMSRVAIFIDGGYVDRVLRDEFGGMRIDYGALSQELVSRVDSSANILRTHYYHCLPYQSDPPTEEESNRFAAKQRFFEAIGRLPRFDVQLGRLARRGLNRSGQYFFEQKMVDVLLSIELVRLSTKGQVNDVILVAGDADFVPALEMAKTEGVSIWLLHGRRPHSDLWNTADERIQITQAFLDKIAYFP